MASYATKLAEAFSAKLMNQVYERSIFDMLVNRDYQGDVQQGSKVNIPALARLSEKTYNGNNLTADSLSEVISTLTVDQFKSFYFSVKTIDEYKSFIKNPASKTIGQRADERKKNVDSFVLGFWGDVAAGHWVGTDYTTGTVAITETTGAVVGTGTTFTSAMVGKPFKAAGHTKWYRVKTFTDTTHIVIENDSDDVASAYDGGTIDAGAAYVIQANTAVTLSASNLLTNVISLKNKLDEAEVPDEDRWLVVPPVIANLILTSTGVNLAVPAVYDELVKRGFITELAGFKVFRSNRVAGDNTSGYKVLAGHSMWLTFADKVLNTGIEEDLIGNFGAAYKDLYVYGAKVADERRKFAALLLAKV